MPNLFPEGKDEVMYNTVDASLLFINALWEYLQHVTEKECDPSFEAEAIKTAESIISWYKKEQIIIFIWKRMDFLRLEMVCGS